MAKNSADLVQAMMAKLYSSVTGTPPAIRIPAPMPVRYLHEMQKQHPVNQYWRKVGKNWC